MAESGGFRSPAFAASIGDVVDLYRQHAGDPYDEQVSQLDHALQTAALARRDDAPDPLVTAALLHDIGHVLHLASDHGRRVPADEDLGHETVGSRYLSEVFGPEVTAPIALHVAAKRYRCAVDPSYAAALSRGSTRSLRLQGGPMSADEVGEFERSAYHEQALRLRAWDDAGKVERLEVAPFDSYLPLLERLARH